MAKLKIYKFPDGVLAKPAKPIERVEKSYYKLADDMLETMYDAPGIGLAANQVGVLDRILVVDVDYDSEEMPEAAEAEGKEPEKKIVNRKPIIIINPKIIHREGKIEICEGCLSVPEYTADVQRSEKIKLEYVDIDGLTQTLDAEGLRAVCIQHEMDHLDGKLFIDRLSPLKREFAKKKLLKARQDSDE